MSQVTHEDVKWSAQRDGQTVGEAWVWERPDRKWFINFGECEPPVYRELIEAVGAHVGEPVRTTVGAADIARLQRFDSIGFVGDRYEHLWTVPLDKAARWDESALSRFRVASPEEFGTAAVREFDDLLRQEIPGLRGWRWSEEAWKAEHGRAYDPELYPVAWDAEAQRFAAMARVWMNPDGPRLGLVAVARSYRCRGVGSALLARLTRALRERGHEELTAECDASNLASQALLTKAGGRRTGGEVELIWRPSE